MLEKGKGIFQKAKSKAKEHYEEHVKPYMPTEGEPLWKRILAWGLFWIVLFSLIFLTFFTLGVATLSVGLPDVRDFDKLAGQESTIIFDREGGILYTIHGEENRKYVPIEDISENLQKATIAIEDDRFYEHIGFDLPGIAAGVLHEIFGIGKRRGGSTITQQLAKNAFLTPERSYLRKLRELILAVRLERAYTKDKILELYLNRIPYGNNAYGAEFAAQIYFSKPAKNLNLAEAAIIASLPQAPTYYSPYGEHSATILNREFTQQEIEKRNIENIKDLKENEYTLGLIGKDIELAPLRSLSLPGRTDFVLRRMHELGYIAEVEMKAAIQETRRIVFKPYRTNIRAPHFVFYVRRLLEEIYGKDSVESAGLKVTTTIDPKFQDLAEKLIQDQVKINDINFGSKNAALLAVDAKTGEVISMVGSADYFNEEIDGNVNMVTALRQPGSSFKPFVYAKAFLNRYNPATVLYDVKTHFGGGYTPDNFDGTFSGPMPIRRALGQSRNIPAIKAYFLAGQEDLIIELTDKMGVKGLGERKPIGGYGPSLGIGSGEIRLIDMVQGFLVFANTGRKKDLVSILKVEDRNGKVLEEWKPEDIREVEALDPQVAFLINDILSDQSVNLGQRLNVAGHTVAVKTGTSNKVLPNKKAIANNLWIFGYTPQIAVGVWSGNSDGSALKGEASGYTASAPIWGGFLQNYLQDKPNESFPRPTGIKEVAVSKASGKLPTLLTPEDQKITEKFASFSVPTELDDAFVEMEVNTVDGLLPNEHTPPEFREQKLFLNHHDPIDIYPAWLAGVKEWAEEMKLKDQSFLTLPPTEVTNRFTEEELASIPTVSIIQPVSASSISVGPLAVEVDFEASNRFERMEFLFDGKVRLKKTRAVKKGQFFVSNAVKEGPHILEVKVYDKLGYFGKTSVEINLEKIH